MKSENSEIIISLETLSRILFAILMPIWICAGLQIACIHVDYIF